MIRICNQIQLISNLNKSFPRETSLAKKYFDEGGVCFALSCVFCNFVLYEKGSIMLFAQVINDLSRLSGYDELERIKTIADECRDLQTKEILTNKYLKLRAVIDQLIFAQNPHQLLPGMKQMDLPNLYMIGLQPIAGVVYPDINIRSQEDVEKIFSLGSPYCGLERGKTYLIGFANHRVGLHVSEDGVLNYYDSNYGVTSQTVNIAKTCKLYVKDHKNIHLDIIEVQKKPDPGSGSSRSDALLRASMMWCQSHTPTSLNNDDFMYYLVISANQEKFEDWMRSFIEFNSKLTTSARFFICLTSSLIICRKDPYLVKEVLSDRLSYKLHLTIDSIAQILKNVLPCIDDEKASNIQKLLYDFWLLYNSHQQHELAEGLLRAFLHGEPLNLYRIFVFLAEQRLLNLENPSVHTTQAFLRLSLLSETVDQLGKLTSIKQANPSFLLYLKNDYTVAQGGFAKIFAEYHIKQLVGFVTNNLMELDDRCPVSGKLYLDLILSSEPDSNYGECLGELLDLVAQKYLLQEKQPQKFFQFMQKYPELAHMIYPEVFFVNSCPDDMEVPFIQNLYDYDAFECLPKETLRLALTDPTNASDTAEFIHWFTSDEYQPSASDHKVYEVITDLLQNCSWVFLTEVDRIISFDRPSRLILLSDYFSACVSCDYIPERTLLSNPSKITFFLACCKREEIVKEKICQNLVRFLHRNRLNLEFFSKMTPQILFELASQARDHDAHKLIECIETDRELASNFIKRYFYEILLLERFMPHLYSSQASLLLTLIRSNPQFHEQLLKHRAYGVLERSHMEPSLPSHLALPDLMSIILINPRILFKYPGMYLSMSDDFNHQQVVDVSVRYFHTISSTDDRLSFLRDFCREIVFPNNILLFAAKIDHPVLAELLDLMDASLGQDDHLARIIIRVLLCQTTKTYKEIISHRLAAIAKRKGFPIIRRVFQNPQAFLDHFLTNPDFLKDRQAVEFEIADLKIATEKKLAYFSRLVFAGPVFESLQKGSLDGEYLGNLAVYFYSPSHSLKPSQILVKLRLKLDNQGVHVQKFFSQIIKFYLITTSDFEEFLEILRMAPVSCISYLADPLTLKFLIEALQDNPERAKRIIDVMIDMEQAEVFEGLLPIECIKKELLESNEQYLKKIKKFTAPIITILVNHQILPRRDNPASLIQGFIELCTFREAGVKATHKNYLLESKIFVEDEVIVSAIDWLFYQPCNYPGEVFEKAKKLSEAFRMIDPELAGYLKICITSASRHPDASRIFEIGDAIVYMVTFKELANFFAENIEAARPIRPSHLQLFRHFEQKINMFPRTEHFNVHDYVLTSPASKKIYQEFKHCIRLVDDLESFISHNQAQEFREILNSNPILVELFKHGPMSLLEYLIMNGKFDLAQILIDDHGEQIAQKKIKISFLKQSKRRTDPSFTQFIEKNKIAIDTDGISLRFQPSIPSDSLLAKKMIYIDHKRPSSP